MPSELAKHWMLDPGITFLNHGSFGACTKAVLAGQRAWVERMEAEPVRFMVRELPDLLDAARAEVAAYLGAPPKDLVFVPNATAGVNAVLRSLRFEPGDEVLTTTHTYNACMNALKFAVEAQGGVVIVATVPFPIQNSQQVADAILSAVTSRTKLLLIDHVTSPTALIFPVESLVRELNARGIDTLIDGAHAPGMLPLDLSKLGAAYYTGNCHKWMGAPKGSGFLFVREDRQSAIRPLAISHGANAPASTRHSRFQQEFDWTGTQDFSAYLSIPLALKTLASFVDGGWPEILRRNRQLALEARTLLCAALKVEPPCPPEMIGAIAAVPLPISGSGAAPLGVHPLQDILFQKHKIEVPFMPWTPPYLRISAQLYNALDDYQRLAAKLSEELDACIRTGKAPQ